MNFRTFKYSGSHLSLKIDLDKMDISAVFPVYNEARNLKQLYRETREVLESNFDSWEMIFVDDGSEDDSYQVISELADNDQHVKAIKFRRNFGQSEALMAGFDHAEGDYIVTMDADLQNDPRDIPRLLDKLKEGYDCVSGWRKDRKDSLGKKLASSIQTKLAMRVGPKIHDFGCTLKVYKAESVKNINLYGESHRYIPSELHRDGYKVAELPVNHRSRQHGNTKYGSFRLLKGGFDLFFSIFLEALFRCTYTFPGDVGFHVHSYRFCDRHIPCTYEISFWSSCSLRNGPASTRHKYGFIWFPSIDVRCFSGDFDEDLL